MQARRGSQATDLAGWYARYSKIGVADRRMIAQVKAIIEKAGGTENARRVLRHHLSDRWRYREQKALEFVLASLDRYLILLGIEEMIDE